MIKDDDYTVEPHFAVDEFLYDGDDLFLEED